MTNITEDFDTAFTPVKALLIYLHQPKEDNNNLYLNYDTATQIYVESYDIGKQGQPINAHPLTLKEMSALSEILLSTQELKGGYLRPAGIIPSRLLYLNQQAGGFAVWYTPPQEVNLFFADTLHIPSGKTKIPAMVWRADAEKLAVFAIKGKAKPTADTPLYHAPYFNIYHNGNVCMGTVQVGIHAQTALEDLMTAWEQYFFNSYFSHSINGNSSTRSPLQALWARLRESGEAFPQEELVRTGYTLKQLIS
ncbi:PRTRC system protein B [Mucilaginibacter kameinonensis]|uniref:PRTRC system protein B n=1 Tax=Mucilaginibacter kameinonensis TaxID=452286 RepID=UPI000EF7A305|nr:PRTRC system protein B [Mucilaginibacter kameinonensis]